MTDLVLSPKIPPRKPRRRLWRVAIAVCSSCIVIATILVAGLYVVGIPHKSAHADPPPSGNPCLSATLRNESDGTIDTNHQARIAVYVFNACAGTVTNITASVTAVMVTCPAIGNGTGSINFQFTDAGTHEIRHTSNILSGACVHCTNGVVDGYPPFDMGVLLDSAQGQDSQNNPVVNGDAPAQLNVHFPNGSPGPIDPPCP